MDEIVTAGAPAPAVPTGGNGKRKTTPPLTSIVVPTYNEAECITRMLDDLVRYVPSPVEIIVVDDDSPDRTWELAEQRGDPRVKVIRRVGTRGLASATVRGIIEARGEVIGVLDAEMPLIPPILPAMIDGLKDHDIVVASRYVEGGGDERSRVRVITSWLLNRLAQILLGPGVLDYDSGIYLMKRSVLDRVVPSPLGFGEYFIDFIYACRLKGLRVCEVPCIYSDRTSGTSKSDVGHLSFLSLGIRYGLRILALRLKGVE
jgi:dolichol-phosphate mannosyltransferase